MRGGGLKTLVQDTNLGCMQLLYGRDFEMEIVWRPPSELTPMHLAALVDTAASDDSPLINPGTVPSWWINSVAHLDKPGFMRPECCSRQV